MDQPGRDMGRRVGQPVRSPGAWWLDPLAMPGLATKILFLRALVFALLFGALCFAE